MVHIYICGSSWFRIILDQVTIRPRTAHPSASVFIVLGLVPGGETTRPPPPPPSHVDHHKFIDYAHCMLSNVSCMSSYDVNDRIKEGRKCFI